MVVTLVKEMENRQWRYLASTFLNWAKECGVAPLFGPAYVTLLTINYFPAKRIDNSTCLCMSHAEHTKWYYYYLTVIIIYDLMAVIVNFSGGHVSKRDEIQTLVLFGANFFNTNSARVHLQWF